ncbi:hypothetical protein Plhal703r1_c19g0084951 [Plasmopara halstedii]
MKSTNITSLCLAVVALSTGISAEKEAAQTFGNIGAPTGYGYGYGHGVGVGVGAGIYGRDNRYELGLDCAVRVMAMVELGLECAIQVMAMVELELELMLDIKAPVMNMVTAQSNVVVRGVLRRSRTGIDCFDQTKAKEVQLECLTPQK